MQEFVFYIPDKSQNYIQELTIAKVRYHADKKGDKASCEVDISTLYRFTRTVSLFYALLRVVQMFILI